MVYKHFRLICSIRVSFLAVTLCIFFYLLFQTTLYSATFIAGIIIFYQLYALIFYVEKTNRDLVRFLQSIKYGDFSQSYKESGLGSSFDALKNAFTEVSNAFRKTRGEKEEHYRYLQTVVQHVGIGLIAFKPNGDVEPVSYTHLRAHET